MSAPIPAPERVLPTLERDGSRRFVDPTPSYGRFWSARRALGLALMVVFVGLPLLRIGGRPLVLLDVPAREFTLVGRTFHATDGVLLMLLMLVILVAIVGLTALFGRVWCGWACPQTVYMEFLFRPLERSITGHRPGSHRRVSAGRRALWLACAALLGAVLGNAFLAYFVGTERLLQWMRSSPSEHPAGFLMMGVTSALVFLDFTWFREQMCTVVCPYARLQSALLDRRSLIVGYDARRGEPRGKPAFGRGDCVDCRACVTTCPTGIDIRDGLQLECIGCAQCIDACDRVMDHLKRPRGLVRYSSQEALETGVSKRPLRVRVVAYALLLAALLVALVAFGRTGGSFELVALRGIGAPFVLGPEGVQNQIRIRVDNPDRDPHRYRIELLGAPDARLVAPENPLPVVGGRHATTSVFVIAPAAGFRGGERRVTLRVTDENGAARDVAWKLLGPTGGGT